MSNYKLIGISGRKQSGKDTLYGCICHLLNNKYHIVQLTFANELKYEVCRATGVTRNYLEGHKENFRLILQGWGTDYRRKLYGEDYWIKKWKKALELISESHNEPKPLLFVTTDVRFNNEANTIRECGGFTIRVNRSNLPEDTHESETNQSKWSADYDMQNDTTIQALCDKVKEVLVTTKML